jgi:hypothetical protein
MLVITLAVGLFCYIDPSLAYPPQAPADNGADQSLHITVLDGEDGVNILKNKMAVKPVVEVRDRNNLPVSGVAITFLAPGSGPRVVFANGSNTFTTTTDANGRAMISTSKPIGRGSFKIKVTANANGHIFTASIAQTNYATVASASSAGTSAAASGGAGVGISATTIALVAIGVAAVVGIIVAVALRGGTKGTIGGAGAPTIGAP